jgi:hypothetical protein
MTSAVARLRALLERSSSSLSRSGSDTERARDSDAEFWLWWNSRVLELADDLTGNGGAGLGSSSDLDLLEEDFSGRVLVAG